MRWPRKLPSLGDLAIWLLFAIGDLLFGIVIVVFGLLYLLIIGSLILEFVRSLRLQDIWFLGGVPLSLLAIFLWLDFLEFRRSGRRHWWKDRYD